MAWYRASREQAFWKRRIDYIKKMYFGGPSVCYFDPFKTIGLCVTLRHKLEWIFRKGMWLTLVKSNEWKRKSCDDIWTLVSQEKSVEFISKSGNINSDTQRILEERTFNSGVLFTKVFWDFSTYLSKEGTGTFYYKSGRIYQGQCLELKDGNIRPHGNGKWTFEDGTILEGECVAYKGEPRFIESPTKRARMSQTGEADLVFPLK
jgi:hypothetical protein